MNYQQLIETELAERRLRETGSRFACLFWEVINLILNVNPPSRRQNTRDPVRAVQKCACDF